MDWENERWVKLYTRSTPSWRMLPWQSRAVLPLLLKEVDRAGQIALGRAGVPGLAALIGLPEDVTHAGLDGLVSDGTVTRGNAVVTLERFVEAQEAVTSNAERQRRFKERRNVAKSLDMAVTRSNARKRGVTCGNDQKEKEKESRVEEKQALSTSVDHVVLGVDGIPIGGTEIERLFVYWRWLMKHPGAKLDAKRRRILGAALQLGYTEQQLATAIFGCSRSPFHRGQNDRKQVYDDLGLIFRDAGKIDQFIREASTPSPNREGILKHAT